MFYGPKRVGNFPCSQPGISMVLSRLKQKGRRQAVLISWVGKTVRDKKSSRSFLSQLKIKLGKLLTCLICNQPNSIRKIAGQLRQPEVLKIDTPTEEKGKKSVECQIDRSQLRFRGSLGNHGSRPDYYSNLYYVRTQFSLLLLFFSLLVSWSLLAVLFFLDFPPSTYKIRELLLLRASLCFISDMKEDNKHSSAISSASFFRVMAWLCYWMWLTPAWRRI